MLHLSHSFRAPGDPADVFTLLADSARVARCLPGATLDPDAPRGQLQAGQELGGRMTVRLGPVSTEFRGVIRVLELDRAAGRSVLGVRAEDAKGNGSATATIALSVEDDDGASRVDVRADVDVRGRVATFGAGAVERVSARLVDQFGANLAQALAGEDAAPAGEEASAPALGVRDFVGGLPSGAGWPLLATAWAFACGLLLGRRRASR